MKIILIEDNKGDIFLIKRVVYKLFKNADLTILINGKEAVTYIKSNQTKPDLIILDINLPHFDGFHILENLKMDLSKRDIPIIIYSSSNSEMDKSRALCLGADKFLVKPFIFDEYSELEHSITEYVHKIPCK